MKKILLFFVISQLLLSNNIFAYTKTENDKIVINKIIGKIEDKYDDKSPIIKELNNLKAKYSNNERIL
jgi:hypothetical protein